MSSRNSAWRSGELKGLAGADRLRWTEPPGWHFTLAFYGEVDEDVVPELSRRLERAARRTEPFPLAVRGGGQFGHGRALWAGAEGDLAPCGCWPTGRRRRRARPGCRWGSTAATQPHLTVARSREDFDVRPYVAALDAFAGRTWTVADLALVRSNLPTSGVPGEQPRYEAVGRWGLGLAGDRSGRRLGSVGGPEDP